MYADFEDEPEEKLASKDLVAAHVNTVAVPKPYVAPTNPAAGQLDLTKRTPKPVVTSKNQGVGIDLASIMVGVLVIGIIGGVISATTFAVIPWAQDASTRVSMEAASAAEAVVLTDSGMYAAEATLAEKGLFTDSTEEIAIELMGEPSGSSYTMYGKSQSGDYLISVDGNEATLLKDAVSIAKAEALFKE